MTQKCNHWTDNHITTNHITGWWDAWDESGSHIVATCKLRTECVESLEEYSADLNGRPTTKLRKIVDDLTEM